MAKKVTEESVEEQVDEEGVSSGDGYVEIRWEEAVHDHLSRA